MGTRHLATVVASATEPLLPALIKPLLDRGFQPGGIALWMVPASLLLLFAVRGTAGFLADLALAKITQDGLLSLRKDMFARLLDARLSLFREQNATALSNTVVFEVQNGATLLVNAVIGLLKDSVSLVALLAYLLFLNWQLTLIVFLIVPGVALLIRTVSRRLYRIARSTQTATNDLAYVVEENVLAARVVRLHGAQPLQAGRFGALSNSLRQLAMKPRSHPRDHPADPYARGGGAVRGDLHRAMAKPRRHHRGNLRIVHHGDADAHRADQAPFRGCQPDLPRTGGRAAGHGPDREDARRNRRHARARACPGSHPFESVVVRYRDDGTPALDGITLRSSPARWWPW